MSSYDFVRGSSHRIGTPSTVNWGSLAHTTVAVVTVASLPGAGAYHAAMGMNSSTAAREVVLHLNGDTGPGTLSLKVGSTRVVPSTSIIPSTDGRWYLIGASKAAGTVNVDFFLFDWTTGAWTEFASSGTVGNRTNAATDTSVGADGAAHYWDGRIAMAMHLPVALVQGQWRTLITKGGFYHLFGAYHRRQSGGSGFLFDLTCPRTGSGWDDRGANSAVYTTGAAPTQDPLTPPGF